MFLPSVFIVSFFCVVQPVFFLDGKEFRLYAEGCYSQGTGNNFYFDAWAVLGFMEWMWMCEGMEGREAATAAEHRVKAGKTFQKCFECVLE